MAYEWVRSLALLVPQARLTFVAAVLRWNGSRCYPRIQFPICQKTSVPLDITNVCKIVGSFPQCIPLFYADTSQSPVNTDIQRYTFLPINLLRASTIYRVVRVRVGEGDFPTFRGGVVIEERSGGLSLKDRKRPTAFRFPQCPKVKWGGRVFGGRWSGLSGCGVPGFGSSFPIGAEAHYTYALSPRHITTRIFCRHPVLENGLLWLEGWSG